MSNNLAEQVHLLKTIADETRLRILGLLAEQPRSGKELAQTLELTAATVSHHMKRLESVGVVTSTALAQRREYRINTSLLRELQTETIAEPFNDAEHQKVLRSFFDGRRLKAIPAKRKARVAVLLELLRRFEIGRFYDEAEVNSILAQAHPDVAFLRRELINYRYLKRDNSTYWVNEDHQERDPTEAQEVPASENQWIATLITHSLKKP